MSHKPTLRLLTIAALVAAMATGCARAPLSVGAPMTRQGAAAVMAAPVSTDALSVARKWQTEAVQVGVSIVHADEGDDVATYVFAAPGKNDAMLLVVNTSAGYKSQEVPMSAKAAEGVAKMMPLSSVTAPLLDSKDLFKKAEAAGLTAPKDLVVLGAKEHSAAMPVAVVMSSEAYVLVDAASGKALSAVSRFSSERRVQMHDLALLVVVVGAVGTGVVWAAKKLIAKFWHPKPKPSATPTPAPTTEPSAKPSPVLSAPPAYL
jgi:hypothetical protein